ncbi:hypothetical protein LP420_25160 [Massilia sp. B-10]|nr:hypothetical protein LP420_25160 [Massilia sp. B-10]
MLTTLGRSLMEPHCWNGTEIKVGAMLRRSNNNPAQVWGWWDASGDFSASMFFCLEVLAPGLRPRLAAIGPGDPIAALAPGSSCMASRFARYAHRPDTLAIRVRYPGKTVG